jgi:hypothetical protein
MDDTDLKDLTIEQLQQVLRLVDKDKNPQQVKEITDLLYAKMQAKNIASNTQSSSITNLIKRPFKKENSHWNHLITAGFLFALALYIQNADKIPFLNIPLDLDGAEFTKLALVLSCVGAGMLSTFQFFREYLKNKRK